MDGSNEGPESGRESRRSMPRFHLRAEREIEKWTTGRRGVARSKHSLENQARRRCAAIAEDIGLLMREFDFTRQCAARYAAKGEPVEHVVEWIEHRAARQRNLAEGLFALVEELDRDLLRHLVFGDADEDQNVAREE